MLGQHRSPMYVALENVHGSTVCTNHMPTLDLCSGGMESFTCIYQGKSVGWPEMGSDAKWD